MTFEDTSRRIRVRDDIELHYHEAGTGMPVVLLHGGGPGASGWSNFNRNVQELSKSFRVLVFDLPQYGRSSKVDLPEDEVYPSTYAWAINEALRLLEIGQADLVGNSLGAGVACHIARDDPERIRRMVLMGPGGVMSSVMTPVPMDALRKMFTFYNPGPPSRKLLREILSSLLHDPANLTDELLEERYQASIEPETLDLFSKVRKQRLSDVTGFVEELQQPTLVLFGLDDRVTPLDSVLYFAKRLPNCEVVLYPRAGHWVMWELPDDFNRAVTEFLSRP